MTERRTTKCYNLQSTEIRHIDAFKNAHHSWMKTLGSLQQKQSIKTGTELAQTEKARAYALRFCIAAKPWERGSTIGEGPKKLGARTNGRSASVSS
jgi:hypothetical protein